ncbi:MAG: amino acid adenylation domain-containing protein [Candidatus Omnitrophota bacterium]
MSSISNENNQINLQIAAGQFVKEKEYWVKTLSGEFPPAFFPYDKYEVTEKPNYHHVVISISGSLYKRLQEITGNSYPKTQMVLTAGMVALLNLYSGYAGTSYGMTIGTAVDRQENEESLINKILPLCVSVSADMTFKELLINVRQVIQEAIENQNYPIEMLFPEKEKLEKLFDVAVLLENLQEKKYVAHLQPSLIFSFRADGNQNDQIEGELAVDVSKYEEESVIRITDHFLRLLQSVLFNVNMKINDIDLFSEDEKKELERFNGTRADYPHQKTIHELFEAQVEKTPENVAIIDSVSASHQLTYRELNEASDRVAQELKEKGIEPGHIVGIRMERSVEMVVAILGVLKAGCAYLPLDPGYPTERIDFILSDSGASALITEITENTENNLTNQNIWEKINLEKIQKTKSSLPTFFQESRAYIIYTSGSTGKPKGVAIGHRSLVNYIVWAAKNYVKNERVNFPLYTSMGFDLTVTSLFTPLITGNTIVVYRGENKEFLLDRVLEDNQVEVIKLTPVHLMVIADHIREKNISKIRRFIVGGDKLDTRLAAKINDIFRGNIEIYNEYGPTEATVGCMIYKYNREKDQGASVPIGVPADNLQIYVLDQRMRHVPVGGIGELYIAGDGLALEYVNNPGLTNEKFLPHPFQPGQRIYKTGDLARRLPGGDLEFLGRTDQQVKIRGYRIEIGEIENGLMMHEPIGQAVVLAKDDEAGYKYLVAYVTPAEGRGIDAIDTEKLRNDLAAHLPEFMVPSYVVKLEKMPVTVNGKIDKKALPDPDKNARSKRSNYEPPTTELETQMTEVWQSVMGVEKVGITDSYFELGGDSIKSIQISARLYNLGWKLELKDLFQYTTIKELAEHIKPVKETADQGMVVGDVPLTPVQEWFFEKNFTDAHHFNLSLMLHRPEGLDEETVKKVFDQLTEHHDALRLVFKNETNETNHDGKIKQIKQINREFSDQWVNLRVFDLRNENDANDYRRIIEETCNDLQASIDWSQNPVNLGLFKTINGDYLLIAIHHLVMDTVSWRIVLEDFIALYRQIETGVEREQLNIPLKSTSYKEWAEKLVAYSTSDTLLQELPYWQHIENLCSEHHGDSGKASGKNRDNRIMDIELSKEYTEKLLKQVNNAYNTEINDILLAALGAAFSDWTGAERVPLMLEGHGREEIIPDIDITRTVGWFTSIYPVVLDTKTKDSEASMIKHTKDMLRAIPFKGIGYGILRYLTPDQHKNGVALTMNPEIGFNYLGQFDVDLNTDFFRISDIPAGHSVSPNMERISPLYILGSVLDGKLKISVNYNGSTYDEQDIRVFLEGYDQRLKRLIDHCTGKKETEFTASDYSVSLDEQEIDHVLDALDGLDLED